MHKVSLNAVLGCHERLQERHGVSKSVPIDYCNCQHRLLLQIRRRGDDEDEKRAFSHYCRLHDTLQVRNNSIVEHWAGTLPRRHRLKHPDAGKRYNLISAIKMGQLVEASSEIIYYDDDEPVQDVLAGYHQHLMSIENLVFAIRNDNEMFTLEQLESDVMLEWIEEMLQRDGIPRERPLRVMFFIFLVATDDDKF